MSDLAMGFVLAMLGVVLAVAGAAYNKTLLLILGPAVAFFAAGLLAGAA